MRNMRIKAPIGRPVSVILDSSYKTLGDISSILTENNIPLELQKYTYAIHPDQTTLVSYDSLLPTQDFILVLLLKQNKAGAMTRSEAYAKVKEFVAADKNAKAFFGNHTQTKTDVLISLIEKYEKKKGSSQGSSAEKVPAKEASPVTETAKVESKSVEDTKVETAKPIKEAIPTASSSNCQCNILLEKVDRIEKLLTHFFKPKSPTELTENLDWTKNLK